MRRVITFALLIFSCSFVQPEKANAGFFFSFATPSSNVLVGEKAIVNIVIESTNTVMVGGIDLGLRSTAGTFVDPVSDQFFQSPSLADWDLVAGDAFYSKSSQSVQLGTNTPTLFATIKVDTTGLSAGTQFTVSFDSLVGDTLANDTNQNEFAGIVRGSPVEFTIVAVPEPSSAILLSVPMAIGLLARRSCKKIKSLT